MGNTDTKLTDIFEDKNANHVLFYPTNQHGVCPSNFELDLHISLIMNCCSQTEKLCAVQRLDLTVLSFFGRY